MTCKHESPEWEDGVLYCDDCGDDITPGPGEECPVCCGDGWHHDGEWCGCPKGQANLAAEEAAHAYMIPMVREANRARREGDEEEYQRIMREAIR